MKIGRLSIVRRSIVYDRNFKSDIIPNRIILFFGNMGNWGIYIDGRGKAKSYGYFPSTKRWLKAEADFEANYSKSIKEAYQKAGLLDKQSEANDVA